MFERIDLLVNFSPLTSFDAKHGTSLRGFQTTPRVFAPSTPSKLTVDVSGLDSVEEHNHSFTVKLPVAKTSSTLCIVSVASLCIVSVASLCIVSVAWGKSE